MTKYIAKPDTWFVFGSEVELIDDYRPRLDCGLFRGKRICEDSEAESHTIGEEYYDEEICPWDEMEEIDE